MRILAVSDETNTPLYNASILRQRAGDAQLIISCGDLPTTYLDFIASVLCRPLLYVRGNHFWQDSRQGERLHGRNLDNRVVKERGLLIGGLEGSMRYKPGAAQYTDGEMWAKFVGMMPRLVLNRLVHGRALDILVTHAAPFGVHDRPDLTHQGVPRFPAPHGVVQAEVPDARPHPRLGHGRNHADPLPADARGQRVSLAHHRR
ncbi:MAG: hypothetical protein M5R40_04050 [Anaerolineae bacterium]|nr:hypothetical protein [Anaerolineae bacterium]